MRARRVLANWLDLEARRLPFSVAQVEKDQQWQRGALMLKLRLDRIDALDDGRKVIVDYKTGASAAKPEPDWSRRRPVNVQLPFYASVLADASGAEVAGLVLAQIHARQVAAGPGRCRPGHGGRHAGRGQQVFRRPVLARDPPALARGDRGAGRRIRRGRGPNVAYRRDDLKYCDALPFLRLHLDDEDA